jgi:hypothetical protein
MAVVYREIKEEGVTHKVQIFDITDLSCYPSPVRKDSNSENQTKLESSRLEDKEFVLPGSFMISALHLENGTLTYSRIIDHYQYRVVQEGPNGKWVETAKGPYIDRKIHKIWMCIGL